ncbi:MAG: phosphate ABC transporter permease subunit PstC [Candidatus Ratteibacteria bacterium]
MNSERFYKMLIKLGGVLIVVLLLLIFFSLLKESLPSIKKFGFSFLISKTWDPVFEKFGALPFITGTLITSFLALIISLPFSISISIFFGEYYKDSNFTKIFESMVELFAGIPSVIYGIFGLFYLSPFIRTLQIKFSLPPTGVCILTASLLLSLMIIPFATSIGKEVIKLIPEDLKEAGYSLGATRYEVIKNIVIPYAKSGIFGGILLSLGRAIGETMAVTMVIGNTTQLTKNILKPANTIASLIANEFTEAVGKIYLSSLFELGFILFLITLIINFIGNLIIKKQEIKV